MKIAKKLLALTGISLCMVHFGSNGVARAGQQSAAVTDRRLQEGELFVRVRANLIKFGWTPVRMHTADNYEYDGTEKHLIDRRFFEVDSCSTDRGSLCILYYAKDGRCLRVDTIGEQVNSMRVTRWDDSCPNEPPKISKAERRTP